MCYTIPMNETDELDAVDLHGGPYEDYIIDELYRYYLKYNDWEKLESEVKNKIDETRDWSCDKIHALVEYLRMAMERSEKARKGIYTPSDGWFRPRVFGTLLFWDYYVSSMKSGRYSEERIASIKRQCTDIVNFLPNPKKNRAAMTLNNL